MLEADDLTAAVKRAEAELAAEQKAVDADRQGARRGARRAEGVARADARASAPTLVARARPAGARDLRAGRRSRRNGVAVAEARDGICTICHVRLRPQVFNTVLRERTDPPVRQLPAHPVSSCRPPRRADRVPQPARDADRDAPNQTGSSPTSTAAPAAIPGPAGYGVRIEQPDGTLVEEFGDSIGVATNNVAEYRGLLAALEWARAHGAHDAPRALGLAAARAADARQLQGEASRACSRCTRRRGCSRTRSAASPSSTSAASRTRTPIGWPTRLWTRQPGPDRAGPSQARLVGRRARYETRSPRHGWPVQQPVAAIRAERIRDGSPCTAAAANDLPAVEVPTWPAARAPTPTCRASADLPLDAAGAAQNQSVECRARGTPPRRIAWRTSAPDFVAAGADRRADRGNAGPPAGCRTRAPAPRRRLRARAPPDRASRRARRRPRRCAGRRAAAARSRRPAPRRARSGRVGHDDVGVRRAVLAPAAATTHRGAVHLTQPARGDRRRRPSRRRPRPSRRRRAAARSRPSAQPRVVNRCARASSGSSAPADERRPAGVLHPLERRR